MNDKFDRIKQLNGIAIGKVFGTFSILICLLNIFYISEEYMNHWIVAGILWLECIAPIVVFVTLCLQKRIYIPALWIWGIVCLFMACIYACIQNTFPFQQLFYYLTLSWIVLLCANLPRHLYFEKICAVIIIIAGIEACWGLMQYTGLCDVYSLRFLVTGSFDNPAGFAIYLAMSMPFALYFIFSNSLWKRITGGLSIIVFVVSIILSESRTGIVAIIVMALVAFNFIVCVKWDKKWWFYLGIFLLGVLLCIGLYYLKKDSADGRLLIWRCTWNMIQDKLFLGHGPGAFAREYMYYQADYLEMSQNVRDIQLASNVRYPFNEYLQMWAEYGLLGLLILGIFVFKLIYVKQRRGIEDYVLKLSLLAISVCGLFSYPLNYPSICCLLSVILGLLMRRSKMFVTKKKVGYLLIGMLSISICIYGIYRMKMERKWKQISCEALHGEAEILPAYSNISAFMRENPLFLYNYGAELYMRELWSESAVQLELCAKQLNDTDIQLMLADCYTKMEHYDKAEKCMILASRMCPNMFFPQYYLVNLYRRMDRKEEALILAQMLLNKTIKIPSYTIDMIINEMKQFVNECSGE